MVSIHIKKEARTMSRITKAEFETQSSVTVVQGATIPLIICNERTDGYGLVFWCKYCQCWHYHGLGNGHRVSHCMFHESGRKLKGDTPYDADGYYIELKKKQEY